MVSRDLNKVSASEVKLQESMKRTCALILGSLLLLAQLFHSASCPQWAMSASPSRCCLLRHSIAADVAPGSPLDPQHSSVTRACCDRSCCTQAPGPVAQTVPIAPASPEVPRILPSVLVMTFLWSLPPAPRVLGSPAPASFNLGADPSVPLITRHCTLLI